MVVDKESYKQPKQSERRQATVMFADISGFTSMSERMDPEEVTSRMNECFTMMTEIVLHHTLLDIYSTTLKETS